MRLLRSCRKGLGCFDSADCCRRRARGAWAACSGAHARTASSRGVPPSRLRSPPPPPPPPTPPQPPTPTPTHHPTPQPHPTPHPPACNLAAPLPFQAARCPHTWQWFATLLARTTTATARWQQRSRHWAPNGWQWPRTSPTPTTASSVRGEGGVGGGAGRAAGGWVVVGAAACCCGEHSCSEHSRRSKPSSTCFLCSFPVLSCATPCLGCAVDDYELAEDGNYRLRTVGTGGWAPSFSRTSKLQVALPLESAGTTHPRHKNKSCCSAVIPLNEWEHRALDGCCKGALPAAVPHCCPPC